MSLKEHCSCWFIIKRIERKLIFMSKIETCIINEILLVMTEVFPVSVCHSKWCNKRCYSCEHLLMCIPRKGSEMKYITYFTLCDVRDNMFLKTLIYTPATEIRKLAYDCVFLHQEHSYILIFKASLGNFSEHQ